jgi:hypothetical protein
VAVVQSGNGDIGAHPLAAGFAERIDALHGKAGQVLHVISLRGRELSFFQAIEQRTSAWRSHLEKNQAPLAGQNPSHDPMNGKPRAQHRGYSVRLGRAGTVPAMGRIVAREDCGVKRKEYKGLWYGCWGVNRDS